MTSCQKPPLTSRPPAPNTNPPSSASSPLRSASIYTKSSRPRRPVAAHGTPPRLPDDRSGVTRYHHRRCITGHDVPDVTRSPENPHYKETHRRKKADPSFSDGADPGWAEGCFHCQDRLAVFFDESNMLHPPSRDAPLSSPCPSAASTHKPPPLNLLKCSWISPQLSQVLPLHSCQRQLLPPPVLASR